MISTLTGQYTVTMYITPIYSQFKSVIRKAHSLTIEHVTVLKNQHVTKYKLNSEDVIERVTVSYRSVDFLVLILCENNKIGFNGFPILNRCIIINIKY